MTPLPGFLWRCDPVPLLAPGFIDLNPDISRGGAFSSTPIPRTAVITWSGLSAWAHDSFRPSFQAVLESDGSIWFNYRDLTKPDHDLADSRRFWIHPACSRARARAPRCTSRLPSTGMKPFPRRQRGS